MRTHPLKLGNVAMRQRDGMAELGALHSVVGFCPGDGGVKHL